MVQCNTSSPAPVNGANHHAEAQSALDELRTLRKQNAANWRHAAFPFGDIRRAMRKLANRKDSLTMPLSSEVSTFDQWAVWTRDLESDWQSARDKVDKANDSVNDDLTRPQSEFESMMARVCDVRRIRRKAENHCTRHYANRTLCQADIEDIASDCRVAILRDDAIRAQYAFACELRDACREDWYYAGAFVCVWRMMYRAANFQVCKSLRGHHEQSLDEVMRDAANEVESWDSLISRANVKEVERDTRNAFARSLIARGLLTMRANRRHRQRARVIVGLLRNESVGNRATIARAIETLKHAIR